MSQSKRAVGLIGAISIGIGGMVGGRIFAVLGEAVSMAHGATAVSFLVAGIVALLTSVAYARLSVKYRSRGGTVVFIDTAFGNNLISGSLNLMLWLSLPGHNCPVCSSLRILRRDVLSWEHFRASKTCID